MVREVWQEDKVACQFGEAMHRKSAGGFFQYIYTKSLLKRFRWFEQAIWLRGFEIVYDGVTLWSVTIFPIRCVSIVTVYCIGSLFCVQLLCYQYEAYWNPNISSTTDSRKLFFSPCNIPKWHFRGKEGQFWNFLIHKIDFAIVYFTWKVTLAMIVIKKKFWTLWNKKSIYNY